MRNSSETQIHQVALATSPTVNTMRVSSGCWTFKLSSNAANFGMMKVNRNTVNANTTVITIDG